MPVSQVGFRILRTQRHFAELQSIFLSRIGGGHHGQDSFNIGSIGKCSILLPLQCVELSVEALGIVVQMQGPIRTRSIPPNTDHETEEQRFHADDCFGSETTLVLRCEVHYCRCHARFGRSR